MTPFVLFSAISVGSLVMAYLLWREVRRVKQALPRLVVTTGAVRELESVLTSREVTRIRSQTLVNVEFVVDGKSYCCRNLYLFAGNRHIGDVGKKFDLPPGQQVGVYYDPIDPRISALIVDAPRFGSSMIAIAVAVIFAVAALMVRP